MAWNRFPPQLSEDLTLLSPPLWDSSLQPQETKLLVFLRLTHVPEDNLELLILFLHVSSAGVTGVLSCSVLRPNPESYTCYMNIPTKLHP